MHRSCRIVVLSLVAAIASSSTLVSDLAAQIIGFEILLLPGNQNRALSIDPDGTCPLYA